jgi:hypothetical protein
VSKDIIEEVVQGEQGNNAGGAGNNDYVPLVSEVLDEI